MRRLSPLVLVAAVAGCSGVPFLVPDSRTAADKAHTFDRRCRQLTEEQAAPLLSPDAVDSVEPAYSYVSSGPVDREARLRGASLHLRPLSGFSREALARGLECHEARVVLGHATPRADDPYVLADHWLDVDVDSEGDGFVVLVRSDETEIARRVLERARAFLAGRARGDAR